MQFFCTFPACKKFPNGGNKTHLWHCNIQPLHLVIFVGAPEQDALLLWVLPQILEQGSLLCDIHRKLWDHQNLSHTNQIPDLFLSDHCLCQKWGKNSSKRGRPLLHRSAQDSTTFSQDYILMSKFVILSKCSLITRNTQSRVLNLNFSNDWVWLWFIIVGFLEWGALGKRSLGAPILASYLFFWEASFHGKWLFIIQSTKSVLFFPFFSLSKRSNLSLIPSHGLLHRVTVTTFMHAKLYKSCHTNRDALTEKWVVKWSGEVMASLEQKVPFHCPISHIAACSRHELQHFGPQHHPNLSLHPLANQSQ